MKLVVTTAGGEGRLRIVSAFVPSIVSIAYLGEGIPELFVRQPVHQRVEAGREEGHDIETVLNLVDRLVVAEGGDRLEQHQQRVGRGEGQKGSYYEQRLFGRFRFDFTLAQ